MMKEIQTSRLAGLMVSMLAAALSFGAAPGEVTIIPVSEIKAGMEGVAYSVFEGTEPETFPVKVVGIMKNAWGPRQDIILVRVGGRFEKTGVAAGMSGSPVYIDGKWAGAISLRIGVFPNDALAGVTPAELMMQIRESEASETPAATASLFPPKGQEETPSGRLLAEISNLLPSPLRAAPASPGYLTPIETPLVFSGFSRAVLDFFSPLFERMGVVAVQGGSDTGSGPMPTAEELKSALPPGSAVSGMLSTGDLALAGTGTVTYNDGHRILAFGHPFFDIGAVEMPMAKAEIVTTLGSSFSPFKIANTGQVVGSIIQDRHSGIMGALGKTARMMPVTVTLHGSGQSVSYHYQVFQNSQWTPLVMLMTFFNTLNASNLVTAETSFKINGAIQFTGYPDLILNSLNVTPPEAQLPPGFMVANWLSQRFNQVFQNRFDKPEITAVNLDVELIPGLRSATIENVWSATSEVHPGDLVPVKIFLRPYRGERIVKEATVKIPGNAAKGNLRVLVSDAETVSQQSQERLAVQQNRVNGLGEIIASLNRERSNRDLYVTVLEPRPMALYDDKLLPSIPSTIANVMDSARAANRLTLVGETAIGQFSIPLDVVVTGGQSLNLTVN